MAEAKYCPHREGLEFYLTSLDKTELMDDMEFDADGNVTLTLPVADLVALLEAAIRFE